MIAVLACVSVMSISDAVLWKVSYRVGVVIVAFESFTFFPSRFMFRSPWMVMVVFGCLVEILSTMCCIFFAKSLSGCGGL